MYKKYKKTYYFINILNIDYVNFIYRLAKIGVIVFV